MIIRKMKLIIGQELRRRKKMRKIKEKHSRENVSLT